MRTSTPGTPVSRSMPSPRIVTAGAIFVASFLFRLSTFSISNDDYLHLSLAQQVLLGDVPARMRSPPNRRTNMRTGQ